MTEAIDGTTIMYDFAKTREKSARYKITNLSRVGIVLGLSLGLMTGCFGPSKSSNEQSGEQVSQDKPDVVAVVPPKTQSGSAPAPKSSLSDEERDPNRLVDLPPTEISEILGPPGRVRKEASMRVWQYRTDKCVLDLFLYKQPEAYRVVYYEFRSPTLDDVAEKECFSALVIRNKSQSADG